MARLTWHPAAINDLDDIARFIARDSEVLARLFSGRLFQAADRLADFPKSGRVVPGLRQDDVREIIVGKYRIVYRLSGDTVRVMAVVHAARMVRGEDLLPESDDD